MFVLQVVDVLDYIFSQVSQAAAYAAEIKDSEEELGRNYAILARPNNNFAEYIEQNVEMQPSFGLYRILCDLDLAILRMRNAPAQRLSRDALVLVCSDSSSRNSRRRAIFDKNMYWTCQMNGQLKLAIEALRSLEYNVL